MSFLELAIRREIELKKVCLAHNESQDILLHYTVTGFVLIVLKLSTDTPLYDS